MMPPKIKHNIKQNNTKENQNEQIWKKEDNIIGCLLNTHKLYSVSSVFCTLPVTLFWCLPCFKLILENVLSSTSSIIVNRTCLKDDVHAFPPLNRALNSFEIDGNPISNLEGRKRYFDCPTLSNYSLHLIKNLIFILR